MADSKLTALTEATSASTDDLLYIVDDPGGSPASKKITVSNLLGAEFVCEAAYGGIPNEVVLGTSVITTAAYGSRQAAAKAGRLFLPNNGFYLERDTAAAWAPWGPIFPLTAPVDGDFAWINQGGASVSTTNGGIFISAPASATDNLRIRKKAAPATPYTITAAFLPLLYSENYHHCGLCFRKSGVEPQAVASFHVIAQGGSALAIQVTKWASATSFDSDYQTPLVWPFAGSVIWLRIADDGANRICSVSMDGQNWLQVHSIGRTDFLTADEVGFFASSKNASNAAGMTLLSWKQA